MDHVITCECRGPSCAISPFPFIPPILYFKLFSWHGQDPIDEVLYLKQFFYHHAKSANLRLPLFFIVELKSLQTSYDRTTNFIVLNECMFLTLKLLYVNSCMSNPSLDSSSGGIPHPKARSYSSVQVPRTSRVFPQAL